MSTFSGDLLRVVSSNMLALLVGLVNGFLVPGFLGIDEYALYKTFGLYVGYVGILHFGFVDGIYIKYGGINLGLVPKSQLKAELLFLLALEGSILVLGTIIGLLLGCEIIVFVALSVFPINMLTFFKFLYQATGSFRKYAFVNSMAPVLTLLSTLTIVFAVEDRRAYLFIIASIAINYLIFVFLFLGREGAVRNVRSGKVFGRHMLEIFRVGFFVMIGGYSSILFHSSDRWFVKLLLKTEDFAFYSLATSMMAMVMIFIRSAGITLYPLLVRRNNEIALIRVLKKYIIIIAAFAASGYFAFDIVIRLILSDYVPSLEIIAILFSGFPAIAVIDSVFVNMYKAQKDERRYFYKVFAMVCLALALNGLAVLFWKSTSAIAFATTLAYYFWFLYSSKDFKGAETNLRETIYIVAFLVVFFTTTRLCSRWIGFALYLAGVLGITFLIYKKEFLDLIRKFLSAFRARISSKDF